MLQLCISQQLSETPFTFRATGIRVYSIEEALYHVYHYWRESADEFSSANMSAWVEGLGLSPLAAKIQTLASISSFSKRTLAFLSLIEYFNKAELAQLKTDLVSWEHRVEWERLKDRADQLVSRGEPAKALPLYRRALKYEENPFLLNNMAIAYIKTGNYRQGTVLLAKAHAAQPQNQAILLHYTEAAILSDDYENANTILHEAEKIDPNSPDILFLRGLMVYRQRDFSGALNWFLRAKAKCEAPQTQLSATKTAYRISHKIAETYVQMHQHDKAIDSLIPDDPTYHIKMSEIYAAYGHAHIPEAIRHLRQAIEQEHNQPASAALWAKLAQYYRMDYDWQRANEAITNALSPGSEPSGGTLLENTRVKKGMGRMREYRAGLGVVLRRLVEEYRTGE